MTTDDDLIAVLKTFVEREVDGEIDRANSAQLPINRREAFDAAIAHQREKLMHVAERCEEAGNEEVADDFRDFAYMLPALLQELDVR